MNEKENARKKILVVCASCSQGHRDVWRVLFRPFAQEEEEVARDKMATGSRSRRERQGLAGPTWSSEGSFWKVPPQEALIRRLPCPP